MNLSGRVFSDAGTGINSATVTVYPADSDTPTDSTTTGNDSHAKAGYWEFTDLAAGVYKVKIEYSGKVRWLHGETSTQFEELNVGTAVRIVDAGTVTLVNPTDPTDGSSVDSPSITLTGAYDSNAGVGAVTRTNQSVTLINDVANDGTYKLSIRNTAGTEKASVSSTGTINAVEMTVGGDVVLHDSDRATMNVDQVDGKHASDFAASDYMPSAAGMLAEIKKVDGAASGLDADLLDGSHLAAILPAQYSSTTVDNSSFVGWSGVMTSLADIVLAVKSVVIVRATLDFDATSGVGAYSATIIREPGGVVVNGVGGYKPDTTYDLNLSCTALETLAAGTYSYDVYSYGAVNPSVIDTTDGQSKLEVIVIPQGN